MSKKFKRLTCTALSLLCLVSITGTLVACQPAATSTAEPGSTATVAPTDEPTAEPTATPKPVAEPVSAPDTLPEGALPSETTPLIAFNKDTFDTEAINSPAQKLSSRDYTYQWWNNGIRKRSTSSNLNILTGYYGLSVNPREVTIDFCGPVSGVSNVEAAEENNSIIEALPRNAVRLFATVGDIEYSATNASMGLSDLKSNFRQIESGQFSQRFDIVNIDLKSADKTLGAYGHMEVHALPEYFSLIYDLMPYSTVKNVTMSMTWSLSKEYTNFTWLADRAVCVTNSDGSGYVFVAPECEIGTPAIKFNGNTLIFSIEPITLIGTSNAADMVANRKGFNIIVIPMEKATIDAAYKFLNLENLVTVTATARTSIQKVSKEAAVKFDAQMGDINLTLPANAGTSNSKKSRNMLDRVYFTIENSADTEVKVPLAMFRNDSNTMTGITGLCAIIRQRVDNTFASSGEPLGLPVQLTKNHHGLAAEELYAGCYERLTTVITVPAHTSVDYEVTIVYSMWGNVNSASHGQLCLVGWGMHSIWEQTSLGSNGENICYEPEGLHCDGAMIDDVRPLMTTNSTKWAWTENVGGGNFLTYIVEGSKVYQNRVTATYTRIGPNLTEVTYRYVTGDGAIRATITSNLGRTDDMTRCYYTCKYEVLQDTTFTRLALYQLGADYYNCVSSNKIACGNSTEIFVKDSFTKATIANVYTAVSNVAWTGDCRWAITYDCKSNDGTATVSNRAMFLRSWSASISGNTDVTPYLSSFATKGGNSILGSTNWEMTLGPNIHSLSAGDTIEFVMEMDIIPKKVEYYYGARESLINRMMDGIENSYNSAQFIAVNNNVKVSVTTGTLNSVLPVDITADNDYAEFTVTNGMGYLPITVRGLSDFKGFSLYEKVNDEWKKIDQSVNDCGNDYWQCYYDANDGTYNITYNVIREANGAVTEFKFSK